MKELKLTYWTNRWKSETTVHIEKTDEGWIFHAIANSGPTDCYGAPHLIGNFAQDNVSYPDGVGNYLFFIHSQVTSGTIDEGRAQEMLDELGDWVSTCERAAPMWRGWNC